MTDSKDFMHNNSERKALPLVSILLPVYNGGAYLAEAIQSILSQTYSNFELVIINDGSTDDSSDIVGSFNDPRIRFYNQENQGLPATLNRAIGLAQGKYLARQDGDDVSFPKRLERQVEFLEANPDYGVVGTWSEIWEEKRKSNRVHKHPADNMILKFNILFDSYFVHSSVMIRKTMFDKVGLYSTEKARQPEDYELWSRIVRDEGFKVANIPEILVSYREVASSICRTGINPFVDRVISISAENLAWASGREVTDPVINDIAALSHNTPRRLSSMPDFKAMLAVLHEAAQRVSGVSLDLADSSLNDQIKMRYKSIRRNYLKYRLSKAFSIVSRIMSND